MKEEAKLPDPGMQREQIVGRMGILLLLTLLALTFFSNTISNFTLPRVEVSRSTSGALVKEIYGEGVVEPKSVWEEYTDLNLRVADVFVGLGDWVGVGEPIMALNIESLKNSFLDEQARLEQLKLTLAASEVNLAQRQSDHKQAELFFQSGYEPLLHLQNAAKNLASAERDLRNIQLNIEIQARKVETLARQVANDGVFTAPFDGIVTALNFSKGSMVNSTKPLYTMVNLAGGFRLVVPVPYDLADYAQPGDLVALNIYSLGDRRTQGRVDRVVEVGAKGEKAIWVDLLIEGLRGGERGQIYLSKRTKHYNTLIPNAALYEDSNGYYVYVLKSRKGPLGTETYVQALQVIVEDTDNSRTALSSMLMDEVVVRSNKPISDGDRVFKERAN